MRSKNKEFIGLEIDSEILAKIKKICEDREMSVSAFIRWVIKNYINNLSK